MVLADFGYPVLSSKIQNAIKLENISNLITSRLVINVYVRKQGLCILLCIPIMADTYQWNVCVRTATGDRQI